MKILALPLGTNGCSYIRVFNPFRKIEKMKLAETRAFGNGKFECFHKNAVEYLEGADVIVFRGEHFGFIDTLMDDENCGTTKKVYVYDSDDNDFLVNPDNDGYKFWGLEDVWYNDRKNNKSEPVWIDEDSEFGKALESVSKGRLYSKKKNIETQMRRDIALSKADMITVTTERLADAYRHLNPNVKVIPNGIDFDLWRNKHRVNTTDEIRIGWSGGSSHYYDFYQIKDALIELIKSNKKLKLVMAGTPNDELFNCLGDQLETHDWVTADGHAYMMQCLNIDIAIIPLAGRAFDTYKSTCKYSEFSAMAVPSVVSNVTPYKEVITHKVNGYLYNNPKEMVKYLKELIDDPIKRITIGNAAYEKVRKEFNSSDIVKDYVEALKKLMEEKQNGTA